MITRFECYNLSDRGRMEIDHVFASGAVVGRATTHWWGCPAPHGGASKHASWHKNMVNSYNNAGMLVLTDKDKIKAWA